MKCIICKHGESQPGETTVTLQRGPCTVIIKNVPADICENCGEYYLTEPVTAAILKKAEMAVQRGAEVEILRYAAQSKSPV
jgi:YgiT-type zinc finger domain-containing protein